MRSALAVLAFGLYAAGIVTGFALDLPNDERDMRAIADAAEHTLDVAVQCRAVERLAIAGLEAAMRGYDEAGRYAPWTAGVGTIGAAP